MAASNTRFTQNSLGQSKTPIDSDHGIYRYTAERSYRCSAARLPRGHSQRARSSRGRCRSSACSVSDHLTPSRIFCKHFVRA